MTLSLLAWFRGAVVFCGALTVIVPAAAQDRVFIGGPQGGDGFEIGAVGRFGTVIGDAAGLALPLAGGGRFVVSGSTVHDRRTGTSRVLAPGARVVEVDPARPRIFTVTPLATTPPVEAVAVFDILSGTSSPIVDVPECPTGFGEVRRTPTVRYAAGGDHLFVERCAAVAGAASDMLVFQLGTVAAGPVITGALPVGASALPSPDGTRLFVGTQGVFGGVDALTAWDTASGTAVASTTTPVATLAWDDTRQWLIVGNAPLPGQDGLVSAWTRDLVALGGASWPGVGPCSVRIATSPHTGRIYVTTGGSDYYGAPEARLAAFAGVPPTVVAQSVLTGPVTRSCVPAVVRTAPGVPRQLRASVVGQTVSVSWQNVGGASSFVLEAGLAPGRADFQVHLGVDARATFAGVPPGAYYIRVRGGNEFGGGRSSDEVRVVVP